MKCTPDPERRVILCGPPGHRPSTEDLAVVEEFRRYLMERHAAEQAAQDQQDQPPRPKEQP